jgi:drug/metabolite transporter (DMT)-like permease
LWGISKDSDDMIDRYKKHWLAWLFLGLLSVIWGTSYILMKKGLRVFSPQEIATLRILLGGVFLLPFSLPQLSRLNFKHYQLLLLLGLLGNLIPAFLVAKAQMHLPSSINGVLNSLTPVFVLVVGMIFFKRKIFKNELLGGSLGVLGSTLLILCESYYTAGKLNRYAILPVVVCLLYGFSINMTKFSLQDLSAQTITSVSLLLNGIIAGIILFTQTNFITKLYTVEGAYQAMGYIGILGTIGLGFAHILFAALIKLASPVFASTVSFLVPVVALMWGVWDQEILIWQHYVGIGIIFVGVYFINQYPILKK